MPSYVSQCLKPFKFLSTIYCMIFFFFNIFRVLFTVFITAVFIYMKWYLTITRFAFMSHSECFYVLIVVHRFPPPSTGEIFLQTFPLFLVFGKQIQGFMHAQASIYSWATPVSLCSILECCLFLLLQVHLMYLVPFHIYNLWIFFHSMVYIFWLMVSLKG